MWCSYLTTGTTASSRLREQVSYEWMETRFVTFLQVRHDGGDLRAMRVPSQDGGAHGIIAPDPGDLLEHPLRRIARRHLRGALSVLTEGVRSRVPAENAPK